MNISQDFSLTASVWDGDKFLIEAATANGSRQMKVTAEVVRAYLNGTAGPDTDRRVLPFRGFIESGEISPSSAAPVLPLEVWFVRSAGRFAVAERSSEPVSSSRPPKLYDNWEGRALYNDGLSPAVGNLYVCQDDRPYWWTGAQLRSIVTDTTGQVIADAIPLDEIDAITAAASRPSSSSPAKSPASTAPAAEEAAQAEEVKEAEEAASQEEAPAAVAEPVAETTEAEEEKEPKAAELIDTTLRSASLVDTTLRSATIIDKSKRSATLIDKSKHSATIIDKSKRSADVTTVTPSARIITVG